MTMANTFRGLLPDGTLPSEALVQVKALAGDSSAGGFYIDEDGTQVPYVMVASVEEPEPTIVIDGRTFEVWWVQLDPPDPAAWLPKPVTRSEGSRAFVVPVDAGAVYTVDGVVRAAGTYAVPGMDATSISWSAAPRSGYSFAPGAVTSGTLEFSARTYLPGDVVFSDSFNRAGVLAGSQTDSFEGGDPLVWTNDTTIDSELRTTDGVMHGVRTGSSAAAYSWDSLSFPTPLDNFDIFFRSAVVDASATANQEEIILRMDNTMVMRIQTGGGTIHNLPTGVAFPSAPSTVPGDQLRIEYRSGQVPVTHNLTRGTVSNYTGTAEVSPSSVNQVRLDFRTPNNTAIGTKTKNGLDSVKVVVR